MKFDDIDTDYLEDHLDYDQRKAIFDGIRDTKYAETIFGHIFHHFIERYQIEQVIKGHKLVWLDDDGLQFADTLLGKQALRESWENAKTYFAQTLGISEKKLQEMVDEAKAA